MKRKKRKFHSHEERREIVQRFIESGMTAKDFSPTVGIAAVTLSRWARDYGQSSALRKHHYTPEQRRHAIAEYLRSGMTQKQFSKVWGIDQKTLSTWFCAYKKEGPKALENGKLYGAGLRRGRKEISSSFKEEIIKKAQSLPEFGIKKLQNVLMRFDGIKVSPNTIKKVLKEAEVYEPKVEIKKKKSPPVVRRFERAKPMQLWQTDITSFVLPRSKQRVYLVVFMDDNSRYIVSWSLALKQTGAFVIECMVNGLEKFGKPEEILSDQGRQYFSWRGKSEFQKLLHNEGIEHVVSRSHHPQTLGKCERFWKTVGVEFWDRVSPKDLKEARERFSHFVNHYNHFRPHQGIDGLVPADKFFEVANEVRESIEKTFSDNELRVALNKSVRKPFFFVGQVGEQKISMHGEKGNIVVQTPNGDYERLSYEEFGKQNSDRSTDDEGKYNKEKSTQELKEKSEVQDAETSNTSEGIVGIGNDRTTKESSRSSECDTGILDRTEFEERSGNKIRGNTAESLANESASSEWDVCSSFEATKDEEEYDSERGRSEILEKEDQGIRRDNQDARSIDRNPERDARMSRGWNRANEESYEEEDNQEGGETWQEAEDTIRNSNSKSDFGWWKKDEE
tara:strand:- start:114512 stop:116374 length:1863 start_codon:yes stop_codon:yes gene_type:complete